MKIIWVKGFCKKSFWGEKYMAMGEKYVQEEFWVKSLCVKKKG